MISGHRRFSFIVAFNQLIYRNYIQFYLVESDINTRVSHKTVEDILSNLD